MSSFSILKFYSWACSPDAGDIRK